MNLDELEFNLLDCEGQTPKRRSAYSIGSCFSSTVAERCTKLCAFPANCFESKLFFMTPDIILGEKQDGGLEPHDCHAERAVRARFFQDFQKVALPLHRDTECCLHALLDGNFPPCLGPMQDIDEMAGHVSRPHPEPFIDALFRLHYTLKGMYLEGNLNEYRPF